MPLPEVPLRPGMIIRMRKPHPCGGRDWLILRTGQKVELRCGTCGRVIVLDILSLRRQGTRIIDNESNTSDTGQTKG